MSVDVIPVRGTATLKAADGSWHDLGQAAAGDVLIATALGTNGWMSTVTITLDECQCGRWAPAIEMLLGHPLHRCHWSRSHRHPAMASKSHVPIKPSARSRRRTR